MRVLITGATGFVGSHVLRLMVGQHVITPIALVREGSDTRRIDDLLAGVEVISGDLFDERSAALAAEAKPDMCLHLAWYAEHGAYWHSTKNIDALHASMRLAAALGENGCKRFVGVGTCVEYDVSYGTLIEDVTPLKPETLYAASKLSMYQMMTALSAQTGMGFAWARLFYLYGSTEDDRRLMPYVIKSLLRGDSVQTTEGTQVRDYLHVEDVASGIWAAAQSYLTGAVNIGAGEGVTVREIVSRIAERIGRPDLLQIGARAGNPTDPPVIVADNTRLKSTGWTPQYDLESGLERYIDWWKQRV